MKQIALMLLGLGCWIFGGSQIRNIQWVPDGKDEEGQVKYSKGDVFYCYNIEMRCVIERQLHSKDKPPAFDFASAQRGMCTAKSSTSNRPVGYARPHEHHP